VEALRASGVDPRRAFTNPMLERMLLDKPRGEDIPGRAA